MGERRARSRDGSRAVFWSRGRCGCLQSRPISPCIRAQSPPWGSLLRVRRLCRRMSPHPRRRQPVLRLTHRVRPRLRHPRCWVPLRCAGHPQRRCTQWHSATGRSAVTCHVRERDGSARRRTTRRLAVVAVALPVFPCHRSRGPLVLCTRTCSKATPATSGCSTVARSPALCRSAPTPPTAPCAAWVGIMTTSPTLPPAWPIRRGRALQSSGTRMAISRSQRTWTCRCVRPPAPYPIAALVPGCCAAAQPIPALPSTARPRTPLVSSLPSSSAHSDRDHSSAPSHRPLVFRPIDRSCSVRGYAERRVPLRACSTARPAARGHAGVPARPVGGGRFLQLCVAAR